MVTDKKTVRCINFKANFKPTRNIPTLVAILYCKLVYLVPLIIKSRALWWQNVNTFNKQIVTKACNGNPFLQMTQITYLYLCTDKIPHIKSTSTKTRRPVPPPYGLKKLTPKGRGHQIHCFQVMFP